MARDWNSNPQWTNLFNINGGFAFESMDQITPSVFNALVENMQYLFNHSSKEAIDLSATFPIGTIYMTLDRDFNPAAQFGGSWTQLKDRFLVGAGGSYSGEGGSASHTHGLTKAYAKFCAATTGDSYYSEYNKSTGNVAEGETFSWTPEYRATDATKYSAFDNPWGVSGATELGGKTDTASNIPPYLAVYMWKRIE